jgi:hypothetical protein
MTAFVPHTAASGQKALRNKEKKTSRVFPCVVFKPCEETGSMVPVEVLAARQPKRVIGLNL